MSKDCKNQVRNNEVKPLGVDDTGYQLLISLLQARDPRALDILARYERRLEVVLQRKFKPYIAHEDIEDIVADTLLHAYKIGERFDPHLAHVFTWLSVLAHYKALDFLRRRAILSDVDLDDVANQVAVQIETVPPTGGEQPSPAIDQVLQRLSPRRAKVIRLHYYEGLSFEEIAELLNISPGGVRSLLSRARADLGELLQ